MRRWLRHYLMTPSISLQIIRCIYHSNRPQICSQFRRQLLLLYSSTTLKFELTLLQSLVVPIAYFSSERYHVVYKTNYQGVVRKLPEAGQVR